MQIFALNNCPKQSAIDLCDQHVVKMILKSAQLLCTAHKKKMPYRKTHLKHPCTLWVQKSKQNYLWLVEHALALCREYTFRFRRVHKTQKIIEQCAVDVPGLPQLGLTPFALAFPDEYKAKDPVQAYRNYYFGEKLRFARWGKGRACPEWLFTL